MSEHRTVVLLNTETMDTVSITAKVRDLDGDDREAMPEHLVDSATITRAAERALVEYKREHPGDYLVVDIQRGEA